MRETLGILAPLLALILSIGAGSVWAGEDSVLYYVDEGTLVLTNTPSRRDVQPVPGFEAPMQRSAALPQSRFDVLIQLVARETGIAARLIKSVALTESNLNPRAVSPKGAMGLMQLMPATAKHYGVTDPFDAYQSLRGGALHLRDLMSAFSDLNHVLAAYNAGSGAVRRAGGIPRYPETIHYVAKVRARYDGRSTTSAARAPAAKSSRPEPAPKAAPIRRHDRGDGTLSFSN